MFQFYTGWRNLMFKNLFLGAAIASLLGATVNANELHEHHAFTAADLEVVANEILKEIKDGTIVKAEQNEAYELVGALQVCAPVVKQASEFRKDVKVEPKQADQTHEKVQASADDLSAIITHLITSLQGGAVDAKDQSNALGLIGGLKMCKPVVENVSTLRSHQHQEATEKAAAPAAAEKPAETK